MMTDQTLRRLSEVLNVGDVKEFTLNVGDNELATLTVALRRDVKERVMSALLAQSIAVEREPDANDLPSHL